MYIKSLTLTAFRSYVNETINFDRRTTVIFGENNVGKSAIGVAIRKLIAHISGSPPDYNADFPYQRAGLLTIKGVFGLEDADTDALLSATLPNTSLPPEEIQQSHEWIREHSGAVTLVSQIDERMRHTAYVEIGSYVFGMNNDVTGVESYPNSVNAGAAESLIQVITNQRVRNETLQARFHLPNHLGGRLTDRYKVIEEFRTRSGESRSGALESMTGADVASVLLNLRNHLDIRLRERYENIKTTFHQLFPRYTIEAVEASAGSGTPLIQFLEAGRATPLHFSQVSAGVHQILGFLVNLVGREGLIVLIEHPEQHLHPHAMRFLQQLIRERAAVNQVIVVTHDPHFITADDIPGFRRVWWMVTAGTRVCGREDLLKGKEIEQTKTVLRHLENREMLFARAVILVEDESQREFLRRIALTLGFNLDAFGVSIIPVHGEDGYKPFLTLLNALQIPVVGLRDRKWGDDRRYLPDRFFSFGDEIEAFLDEQGLADRRMAITQERGTSKRRVAGYLAASLEPDQIAPVFRDLLTTAQELATGEPAAPSGDGAEPDR